MQERIKELIRYFQKELRMTDTQVVVISWVSLNTIRSIKYGEEKIGDKTLKKILQGFLEYADNVFHNVAKASS